MHEMMSDFARHAMERLGDEGRVPAFESRISGGDWGEYRANLEDARVVSAWADFVRITEIMHDRVHHAMYKSAAYDRELRGRDVELSPYVGDRAPYAPDEVSLDRAGLTMEYASSDALRALVWHHDIEDERLHAAMQKLMVFDEILSSLMTEWALHGAEKDAAACRPPELNARIRGDRWQEYATMVETCDDAHWRRFVQVVGLMHDRIRDLMYRAILHDAEFHGRDDQARGLPAP